MNKPRTPYAQPALYHKLLMMKKQLHDFNPQNQLMSLASKQSFFFQSNYFLFSEMPVWPIFNNDLQKQ